MIAAEFINSMVPFLKPKDTAALALELMEEFQVEQLPVVKDGVYQGMALKNHLSALDGQAAMEDVQLEKELATINENLHFFEVVKTMTDNQCTLVAVLDENRNYLGVVTSAELVEALAHSYTMQAEGTIVVLELYMRDLNLSELTRILEAENVKMLGMLTHVHDEDAAKILLTLKLNTKDSSRALATLERFNYQVVAEFNVDRHFDVDQARLDNLIRFLNV